MPKVLVAIDGSAYASRAFAAAAKLCGDTADYVMLSVIPPWSPSVAIAANEELGLPGGEVGSTATHGTSTAAMPYAPTAESVQATIDGLYAYFEHAQTQAESIAGVKAEHAVDEAKPTVRKVGRALCEYAAANDIDLIVVGSHGASHAGEMLLGSVSQYVMHNASCPVMVVRP